MELHLEKSGEFLSTSNDEDEDTCGGSLLWSKATIDYFPSDVYEPLVTNDSKWDVVALKRRVWVNMFLSSASYFFLFMGIIPILLLQSSLNSQGGLGVTAMAIKNAFMVTGSVLAPSFLRKFGCKTSIVVGDLCYISFIVANIYPSWFTLVPLAMLSGTGYALESVARKVYVARLAHFYAAATGTKSERINSRLFVLMACAVFISGVGNVIVSYILDDGVANDMYNVTNGEAIASRFAVCGTRYCNQPLDYTSGTVNGSSGGSSPEEKVDASRTMRVYLIIGFCLTSSLFSVVLISCLDPLSRFRIKAREEVVNASPLAVIKSIATEMKHPFHLLFIPIVFVSSGGDSFWTADFTKAFITCSIGMSSVGYVSVWNGIGSAISCLSLGWYNNKTIRSFPVLLSTLLQLTTLTSLFYWVPSEFSESRNYWTLSLYSFLFHFGSGIRHFIIPVLISVVFKDNLESAFSVYHLWSNLSSMLIYALSSALCITLKIYLLMAMLALSFLTYVIIEILLYNKTI